MVSKIAITIGDVMKRAIYISNIILALAVVILDIFYIIEGGLLLKGITSAGFVLIGIVNLVYALTNTTSKLGFSIVMAIGLVFGMAGDIVLEIHFISGAALFGIAHIFFFVSYCQQYPIKRKDFIPAACMFVPCLILLLLPIFDFGGIIMHMVCICYAAVISCMVGKSISNYIKHKTSLNLIIMIGSILFAFSDVNLVFNMFSTVLPSLVTEILCLATYYPAECILAYSILHGLDK